MTTQDLLKIHRGKKKKVLTHTSAQNEQGEENPRDAAPRDTSRAPTPAPQVRDFLQAAVASLLSTASLCVTKSFGGGSFLPSVFSSQSLLLLKKQPAVLYVRIQRRITHPPHTDVGCIKPPGLIKADKPAAAQHITEVLHQGAKWVLGTRAFQKAEVCFCFFSMSQTGAQVLTVKGG